MRLALSVVVTGLLTVGIPITRAADSRPGIVFRLTTSDAACPPLVEARLDGVLYAPERMEGCVWRLRNAASGAMLTVIAPGYLEESASLDGDSTSGAVEVHLTPSDELLPDFEPMPPPTRAPAGHDQRLVPGYGEVVSPDRIARDSGEHDTFSGTVGLNWIPDALQSDVVAPGGAFGRTALNTRRTAATGVDVRTSLFDRRLAIRAGYAAGWWTSRAIYEPPAQQGPTGAPVTTPRTDDLASRLDQLYDLELAWLPTLEHRLVASIHGANGDRDGLLYGLGDRISPVDDRGLDVREDDVVPGTGTSGSADRRARTALLGYTFRRAGYEAGLWFRDYRFGYEEQPAPGTDVPMYVDRRRDQVHVLQALNRFEPVTPLEQVRFGGFGLFQENRIERQTWGAHFSARFGPGESMSATLGVSSSSGTLRERQLRTGRRGADGVLVYLADNFGGPIRESYVNVQGGVSGGVICLGRIDPSGRDLLEACPGHVYVMNRGEVGPPTADIELDDDRIDLTGRWRGKTHSVLVTLSARHEGVVDPTDYTLLGALTGEPLIGLNGYPVGTFDPDVPPGMIGSPTPPRLIAGPGRFVGGRYKFPIEPGWNLAWQWQLDRASVFTASWARTPEELPDELLHHLFDARLSVVQGFYQYPDETGVAGHAFVSGGEVSLVAPGTRLGSYDDFVVGLRVARWRAVEVGGELFVRRQARILAQTQSNPLENVVNRTLDTFFYRDSIGAGDYCLSCPRDQASAFPNYVPGMTGDAPNPDSRGYLSLVLANPGDNTDPALFGSPSRESAGVRISTTLRPTRDGRLSIGISGQWSRTRGNYDGLQIVGDDQDHPEPRTIFAYPQSNLTRSQYAKGPLPEEFPTYGRVDFRWEPAGADGLKLGLTAEWRQGTMRTPWLAAPLSPFDGNLPGTQPDYYQMDMDLDGYADRLVLRDFTPERRDAFGRNSDQLRFDAGLLYRHAGGRTPWRVGVAVVNLTNNRPTVRDDRLEIPVALYHEVVPSAPGAVLHVPTVVDLSTRIANPDLGGVYAEVSPRAAQLLFGLDF